MSLRAVLDRSFSKTWWRSGVNGKNDGGCCPVISCFLGNALERESVAGVRQGPWQVRPLIPGGAHKTALLACLTGCQAGAADSESPLRSPRAEYLVLWFSFLWLAELFKWRAGDWAPRSASSTKASFRSQHQAFLVQGCEMIGIASPALILRSPCPQHNLPLGWLHFPSSLSPSF